MKDKKIIIGLCIIIAILIILLGAKIMYGKNKNVEESYVKVAEKVEGKDSSQEMKIDYISPKEPDGKPFPLIIKGTKEESSYEGNKYDMLYVDDFILSISSELKEQGYQVKLLKNNTVLNIVSKDNLYEFSLVRYSDISPYQLTEAQSDEFFRTENKIAFYQKYNINPYTTFDHFTQEEFMEVLRTLGITNSNVQIQSRSKSNDVKLVNYNAPENSELVTYEIGEGDTSSSYFRNRFKGAFAVLKTYKCSEADRDKYGVRLVYNM